MIYGKFIDENIIKSLHTLYKTTQTYRKFDIQWVVWKLTVAKELFLIGIKFLFISFPEEEWEWFLSFNKWVYTGVIFINVINFILNTGKIVNLDHDE